MPRCFIDNEDFTDRKPETPGYAASAAGTPRAQAIDIGRLHRSVKAITATYTAMVVDDTLLCDASGGAFTVTLPDVADAKGHTLNIKKTDSSANAVTIQPA